MKKIDIENLPKLPGVYLFKNAENTIIYVGKAVSIKDRVKNYFQKNTKDWKVDFLLQEAVSLDYIITKNEEEALVLEAQMVKELQPKFNVLLKEGNPFVYFLITKPDWSKGLPTFEFVRTKKDKGTYFGPFINKQKARAVHEFLVREFRLRLCNKKIAGGCLDYHLGFCSGSCRDDFSATDYLFRLELVKTLLQKNFATFKAMLQEMVEKASKDLDFERAAHFHKYLENIGVLEAYIENNYRPEKFEEEIVYKKSALSTVPLKANEIGGMLKDFLNLDYEPSTIDCFDISHFQGKWIVGSCVRFTNGLPEKNKFRHFKIKTLTDQNDYAALQEIVMRRYRDRSELPDIVMIDGGKGQLSSVKAVLPEAYCISLAKREETLYGPGFMDGKLLDLKSEVGKLLIGIRDYAHHFAISYHRKKRSL